MFLAKNLDSPDESRSFGNADLKAVSLGDVTFARADFMPGWRWSKDMKPLVGTDSCQVPHRGVVVSGRFFVKMDSGEERELVAGDAHVVDPGHDAWVVGDEPCVIFDFSPASGEISAAGEQSSGSAHVADCPCGVSFRVDNDAGLDHLVAAVQEHALGSHDQRVSREHILEEVKSPGVA
jgi:hypothetical protein